MIDIIFLILMLAALVRGLQRGLIVAIFSVLAAVIGLAAAMKLSVFAAHKLEDHFNIAPRWLPIIAFLLVFLLFVLLIRWLANLLEAALDMAWMGWLNKLGGVLLYALLFAAVYSVLLFYGTTSHILADHTVQSSLVYPYIEPWGPSVINGVARIIPVFKDMFAELKDFFGKLA